jgi:GntR family transcriptional regulator, transcriptional repressor for pyruvate dehydrogenase complex
VASDADLAVDAARTPTVAHSRIPKASDVVAARLRAQILGEAMPVGTELPSEAEMIESFGFSRSTVREALRLLEADGLIVSKRGPGGGIRVSGPDIDQISRSMAILLTTRAVTHREFLAFRRMFEPPLAGLAASAATTEQREWLLRLAKNEQGEQGEYSVRASVEFHEAIGVCTNNGVAQVVLSAMQGALEGHVRAESLSSEDILGTTRGHVRIAKLVHDGNAEAAEQAMRRHLDAYMKAVDARDGLDYLAVAPAYWQPR